MNRMNQSGELLESFHQDEHVCVRPAVEDLLAHVRDPDS